MAFCGSIINGIDHFWSGESRSCKQKPDFRILDLYYCPTCKSYYLKCPRYNTVNLLTDMPDETRTIVMCSGFRKRVLYAEGDYSMGGG